MKWLLFLIITLAGCGGSQQTETLCTFTRGGCAGCTASLQQWCSSEPEEQTEAIRNLCATTTVLCRVCIEAEAEYCE